MIRRSDLELVVAILEQSGYASHAERLLFELEDEGRIELIRMAVLEKNATGKVVLEVIPGRHEEKHGFKHMIEMDIDGLFAWMIGRLFGRQARSEAYLTAGRGVNLDLSGEHINLVAKTVPDGGKALLFLVEDEFVAETQRTLHPFVSQVARYRLSMNRRNGGQ